MGIHYFCNFIKSLKLAECLYLIPALRRQRWSDLYEFDPCLVYIVPGHTGLSSETLSLNKLKIKI